jgi:Family of unknown function (DUF5335)
MASRTIPQPEWRAFFDSMADALVGKRAEVEVASLDLGDQIVAEWVPLLGVTYDAQDDLLDVALSGLNHLIRRPKELYIQEGPQGIHTSRTDRVGQASRVSRMPEFARPPAAERRKCSQARPFSSRLSLAAGKHLRPMSFF